MKKISTLIGWLIIFGSLITSVFIVGKGALTLPKPQPAETNAPNAFEPVPASLPTPSQSETLETNIQPNGNEPQNATQALAKLLAGQLIKNNPQGPALLNGERQLQALNPDSLIETALASELENFDYLSFKTYIPISQIKINPASDPITLQKYLGNFQAIIKNESEPFAINLENPSAQEFSKIAQVLETTINDLLNLPAPTPLAALHAEEISLLTAQKNIFTALAAADADPLKALLAAQAFPIINQELENLSEKFTEFISANNLTL